MARLLATVLTALLWLVTSGAPTPQVASVSEAAVSADLPSRPATGGEPADLSVEAEDGEEGEPGARPGGAGPASLPHRVSESMARPRPPAVGAPRPTPHGWQRGGPPPARGPPAQLA